MLKVIGVEVEAALAAWSGLQVGVACGANKQLSSCKPLPCFRPKRGWKTQAIRFFGDERVDVDHQLAQRSFVDTKFCGSMVGFLSANHGRPGPEADLPMGDSARFAAFKCLRSTSAPLVGPKYASELLASFAVFYCMHALLDENSTCFSLIDEEPGCCSKARIG